MAGGIISSIIQVSMLENIVKISDSLGEMAHEFINGHDMCNVLLRYLSRDIG